MSPGAGAATAVAIARVVYGGLRLAGPAGAWGALCGAPDRGDDVWRAGGAGGRGSSNSQLQSLRCGAAVLHPTCGAVACLQRPRPPLGHTTDKAAPFPHPQTPPSPGTPPRSWWALLVPRPRPGARPGRCVRPSSHVPQSGADLGRLSWPGASVARRGRPGVIWPRVQAPLPLRVWGGGGGRGSGHARAPPGCTRRRSARGAGAALRTARARVRPSRRAAAAARAHATPPLPAPVAAPSTTRMSRRGARRGGCSRWSTRWRRSSRAAAPSA